MSEYKEPEVINPPVPVDEVTSTIQKELDSVNKKIEKLQKYIESDKYASLPDDKKALIDRLKGALEDQVVTLNEILNEGDDIVDPYLGAEETKKDPSINPSLPEFNL